MCPSDAKPHYELQVVSDDRDATVTLLDAWDTPVELTHGRATVPEGLYTARADLLGRTEEKVVRVDRDQRVEIPAPPLVSAAPLHQPWSGAGYVSSHEYYTDPAADLSNNPTRQPLGVGPHDSRVMVFVRAFDRAHAPAPSDEMTAGMELVSADQMAGTRFGPNDVRRNDHGWAGLCADAAPGQYYLTHHGVYGSRRVPLHLAPGWSTLVFVPWDVEPELASAYVVLSRRPAGFSSSDEENVAVDRALAVLQAGRGDVRGGSMQALLYGKFDNPMLGLIGLHILLRRPDLDPHLLETVIANVRHMLGAIPDVQAGELAAKRRLDPSWVPAEPFTEPPMLRAGLAAIVDATAERPEIVAPGSTVEEAALHGLADSPWTSWSPPEEESATDAGLDLAFLSPTHALMRAGNEPTNRVPTWVREGVFQALEKSTAHDPHFAAAVSRRLGVPAGVIERMLRQLAASDMQEGGA